VEFKKLAKKLKNPLSVQKYLRQLNYNREEGGETLRSAHSALIAKKAHCLEAALLAAAILENLGYPPLVLSFESQDGLDHVLFVYKHKSRWGSIGRSRDEGLHGRNPVFRSLRDLAWSYYAPYIDKTGKITAYQLAHLDDTKTDWRRSRKNVWKVESYLLAIPHKPLKSSQKSYHSIKKRYLKHGPIFSGPNWL
jgi:hypothetical protein